MISRFRSLVIGGAVLAGSFAGRSDSARADAPPTVAELGKAAVGGTTEKRLAALDQLTDLGPDAKAAVPQLVEALGSGDIKVRWHAARALGAIGPGAAEAAPKLAAALDDKDARVRSHAAHALGSLGAAGKKYVPQLIARITDDHANVRREVILAVEAVDPNDPQVVRKISDALSAAEPAVALAAVKSLAAHGERALPAAIDVLKKSKPKSKARYWACVLLQEFGPAAKGAVEPLAATLDDEDPTIRMQAALALAEIGPDAKPAVPALIDALGDKLEAVQYAAAYALGNIGSQTALPALRKAARSDDSLVKLLAIWAIAKATPDDKQATSDAIDAIVDAMEDSRAEVRQAAARALWDLKPPHDKIAPALSRALNDDDPEVVSHVIDSLASLGEKIAPRVLESLKDEKRRPKALAIVQRMGPTAKTCVPELIKLLGETEDGLKTQVLGALAAIGPDAAEAVGPISAALGDDSDRVASAACIALGHIGPAAESAVPALEKQLAAGSIYTQQAGAWALVHIEPDPARVAKKVLPLLIKSLRSPVELVRIHAAETLGALGPAAKPAVKQLKQAAADSSPGVGQAASAALAAIEQQPKSTKTKSK